MKGNKQIFVCSNCGAEYSKWSGKCDSCNNWNTLKEFMNKGIQINNIKNSSNLDVDNNFY